MDSVDPDSELPAIVAGHPEAFGRWVAGNEHALRQSLRRFAVHVDTEAVVQETLLRVWQVAPRVRPDGQPRPLLRLAFTIARNLALSEARRRPAAGAPIPLPADEQPPVAGAPSAPDPFLRQLLAECKEKLPPQPAAALTCRLQSGGAERDEALAASLSMRLNTFLQNVTRARKLLAECLKERGVRLEEELV